MTRYHALILSLAIAGPTARAQSPDEIKDGFVSMFNGKDFSGWRFGAGSAFEKAPKNWSVEEGVIKLHGGGSPHLASQWDYEDFDMRFEWKALKNGYNSGFYVRSGRNVGANQINLAQKAAGNLMGTKGGPGVPELQKLPGEWNEWRVVAQGDKLTFWCNDKKAWEVIGFKPARGYVGLQAEGAAIDFKNLRIKELGYTPLNDLKQWQAGEGWMQKDDILLAEGTAKPMVRNLPAQFTLRLEYQGEAALQRGGKTLLAFSDTDIKGHVNPPLQWNYLEMTLKLGKLRVTINNTTTMRDAAGEAGDLAVVPSGPVALRNIRIREEK